MAVYLSSVICFLSSSRCCAWLSFFTMPMQGNTSSKKMLVIQRNKCSKKKAVQRNKSSRKMQEDAAQQMVREAEAASIAQSIDYFFPNAEGLKNHNPMWVEMLQQAAEGHPAELLDANGREFLHEGSSIEFNKAFNGLSNIDGEMNKTLPAGDVYVGLLQLSLKKSDYLRVLINKTKISNLSNIQDYWPKFFSNFKFLMDWLDYAATHAVFRPCHCKGRGRDRRTFHQKADGLYVLTYKDDHIAFGLLEPRSLVMLDYYLNYKEQWEEYKLMVAWARALYLKRISA